MIETVKAYNEKYRLWQAGDRIVAACSGGPDSLVLVHILHSIRLEYNISVYVAHVDHMFRGEESAAEARYVEELCTGYGLPCFRTAIDVPAYMAQTGLSGQVAAREVRYRYLREVAAAVGGAKIATGHHADDQAETVLLHVLRGTGSAGLRGMLPCQGDVIRPLLGVTRAAIAAYAAAEGLRPCYDSSNSKLDYRRNRIRLQLLPQLEQQYNPRLRAGLCRMAEVIGDEHDMVAAAAAQALPSVLQERSEGVLVSVKPFRKLHKAVQREIFRQIIEKKQGSLTGITFHHVEMLIQALLSGRVGSCFELPHGWKAYKTYQGILLAQQYATPEPQAMPAEMPLAVPGNTPLAVWRLDVVTAFDSAPLPLGGWQSASFDAAVVVPPLCIRMRRPGDRFQPGGMQGTKKLKDFFIDQKVPQSERDRIPLLCDQQGILWVIGYRQSERARVTAATQHRLQVIISKQEEQV